jgi:large subunit ribosomal protein L7/L12
MKTKINKFAREIAKLDVAELDELTSLLMNKYGMASTLYHYSPGIMFVETSNECDLVLLETGPAKLMVVKVIKEAFGLGLREAKDILDSVPCYLKKSMESEEAEKIQEELEAVGAKTEINYKNK